MKTFKNIGIGLISAAALAFSAMPAGAAPFTVAVVSDTQNYSDITLQQPLGEQIFSEQMQYLVDNQQAMNLSFVTFVGDIVQHGDGQFRHEAVPGSGQYQTHNSRAEWDIANRAISILSQSELAFGMVPGNHDYDNYSWWTDEGPGASRPLKGSRTWTHYFGPQSTHFQGKPWYKGTSPSGFSSYQIFEGEGQTFLHLALEMHPPQAALDWAQGVMYSHPDLPVIMTTHEWLRPDTQDRANGVQTYFPATDHLSPNQIWDRFVRKNPRIFLILSGHYFMPAVDGLSSGEQLRIDTNDAGHPVYQVLQDYQGTTVGPDGKAGSVNGGAGWMRFMTFDPEAKTIRFSTYSTHLKTWAGRDGKATFGTSPERSEFTLAYPPQLIAAQAASGR